MLCSLLRRALDLADVDQVHALQATQRAERQRKDEVEAAEALRVAEAVEAVDERWQPTEPAGQDDEAMLAAAIQASLEVSQPDYSEQVAILRSMGFVDDAANQVALEAAQGNVERALEMLLG